MIGLNDPHAGRRIHERLAGSLDQIAEAGVVSSSATSAALKHLSRRLREGESLRPERFREYFKILRAAQVENQRAVESAARNLVRGNAIVEPDIRIRPLADSVFDKAGQRQVRLDFGSESLTGWQLTRIPEAKVPEVVGRIETALDLLRTHAPDSYALVAAITREIIPLFGRARNGMTFDGCSSVERWGSILINMRRERTDLVLAETLVHESNHSYLFDLTSHNRLSMNGMDERYKSPLRLDPRPIDGIFHAVFVLAHMYAFLREVAENPKAPDALRAEAREVAQTRAENFNDGYGVLAEHARLTETGQTLLDRVRRMVPV